MRTFFDQIKINENTEEYEGKGSTPMYKKTDARQSKLFAGLTGIAAFALLTACAADGPAEEPPADQEVEQSVQPEATQQDTPDDDATAETDDATADDTAASGDDPVFAVIDAVEAEYDGGFIVDIDRDDNSDSQFEVDVVMDNEVHELDVTADGTITVDDRESDDDDVAEAEQATVTVTDALNQAFEQHSDATFDQISLDEDDGALEWEIELDDANGSDIELNIPATS